MLVSLNYFLAVKKKSSLISFLNSVFHFYKVTSNKCILTWYFLNILQDCSPLWVISIFSSQSKEFTLRLSRKREQGKNAPPPLSPFSFPAPLHTLAGFELSVLQAVFLLFLQQFLISLALLLLFASFLQSKELNLVITLWNYWKVRTPLNLPCYPINSAFISCFCK